MSHLFEHFPREVNMRTRKVVKSMYELQKYIDNTNGKDNLTTTVYGFRSLKPKGNRCEYNTAIIPHFVIDLDKGRAELEGIDTELGAGTRCTQDTLNLAVYLKENDIRHAIWMSGGGYHIWVMLDQVYDIPSNEMSNLLFSGRAMINKWINDMDLITVDPVVSFRPDRHIRIPNTYNSKRKLWSIPLSIDDLCKGWEAVKVMAGNPSGGMKTCGNNGLSIDIVEFDENNPHLGMTKMFQNFDAEDISIKMDNVEGIPMLPCLQAACCDKGSNPPHISRSYLMMYLLDYYRGFARPPSSTKSPIAEIINKAHSFIYSLEWSDYKPKITQEMLVHGASREYLTPSCPTIYREGLCIGRCPFYDGKGVGT